MKALSELLQENLRSKSQKSQSCWEEQQSFLQISKKEAFSNQINGKFIA